MKKILCLLLTVTLFSTLALSQEEPNEEIVQKLLANERFKDFTKSFITNFIGYANYHNPIRNKNESESFVAAIKASDHEESSIAEIYSKYGLSFDEAMTLKAQVDNDILQALYNFPELQEISDDNIMPTLMDAMESGIKSTDDSWIQVQIEITETLNNTAQSPGLTIGEVWSCIKQSLGLGAGSVISIAGLNKLMHEGVQTVVKTVASWLAKRCGWIGLAITLFDVSVCIWEESRD